MTSPNRPRTFWWQVPIRPGSRKLSSSPKPSSTPGRTSSTRVDPAGMSNDTPKVSIGCEKARVRLTGR